MLSCADLPAQGIIVSGRVTDALTGAPLPGISITIKTPDGQTLDTLSTNSAGAWSQAVLFPAVVPQSRLIPSATTLGRNYPNPFNPSTWIPFQISRHGVVRLSVHNILGQKLDSREFSLSPGFYAVVWKGKGSAGVLFYSMECDGARQVGRMVQLDGHGEGGLGGLVAYAGAIPAVPRKTAFPSCWVVAGGFAYEEDVTRFAELTKVLLRRGYSRVDVRKILGENFFRVMRSVCR
ncbi:MAG TPA: membrane dipeptidase [Bacteroidota bacterium]|nr:membrane dipeptidase [Bacteroidota bacterium]